MVVVVVVVVVGLSTGVAGGGAGWRAENGRSGFSQQVRITHTRYTGGLYHASEVEKFFAKFVPLILFLIRTCSKSSWQLSSFWAVGRGEKQTNVFAYFARWFASRVLSSLLSSTLFYPIDILHLPSPIMLPALRFNVAPQTPDSLRSIFHISETSVKICTGTYQVEDKQTLLLYRYEPSPGFQLSNRPQPIKG